MRCEACGHSQPDPKPVVVEKVKEVLVGENAFWLQIWTFVFILLMVVASGITIESTLNAWNYRKALETPGVKIEEVHYDSSGRPTMKVTK